MEALAQARGSINALTAHTSAQVLAAPSVSLARVTLRPGLRRGGDELAARESSERVPTYVDRLAWVVALRVSDGTASCPSQPPSPASPPVETGHQDYVVIVQDAEHGGDAMAYTGRRQALCGGQQVGPSVDVPRRLVSVPWRLEEGGRLTYTAPACGHFQSAGAATSSAYAVVVSVPLGPACAGPRTATLGPKDVGRPAVAAPVGPLG